MFYEGEFGEYVKINRFRSTKDLNTKEMTIAIERFRNWTSKELGVYLPEPSDMALIQELEIEVSKFSSQIHV